MNNKTIINLVLIVVVCAGSFFGYRYFFGQGDEMAGVTTVGAGGAVLSDQPMTDYESQQFIVLLASVKDVGVKLREDFVNDQFFLKLKDYTVPVTDKPISRANPFLPIGVGGPYIETKSNLANDIVPATTTSATVSTSTSKATTTKKMTTASSTFEGSF